MIYIILFRMKNIEHYFYIEHCYIFCTMLIVRPFFILLFKQPLHNWWTIKGDASDFNLLQKLIHFDRGIILLQEINNW